MSVDILFVKYLADKIKAIENDSLQKDKKLIAMQEKFLAAKKLKLDSVLHEVEEINEALDKPGDPEILAEQYLTAYKNLCKIFYNKIRLFSDNCGNGVKYQNYQIVMKHIRDEVSDALTASTLPQIMFGGEDGESGDSGESEEGSGESGESEDSEGSSEESEEEEQTGGGKVINEEDRGSPDESPERSPEGSPEESPEQSDESSDEEPKIFLDWNNSEQGSERDSEQDSGSSESSETSDQSEPKNMRSRLYASMKSFINK